jgi:hypothetical protein
LRHANNKEHPEPIYNKEHGVTHASIFILLLQPKQKIKQGASIFILSLQPQAKEQRKSWACILFYQSQSSEHPFCPDLPASSILLTKRQSCSNSPSYCPKQISKQRAMHVFSYQSKSKTANNVHVSSNNQTAALNRLLSVCHNAAAVAQQCATPSLEPGSTRLFTVPHPWGDMKFSTRRPTPMA